jgi:hypothetical protein
MHRTFVLGLAASAALAFAPVTVAAQSHRERAAQAAGQNSDQGGRQGHSRPSGGDSSGGARAVPRGDSGSRAGSDAGRRSGGDTSQRAGRAPRVRGDDNDTRGNAQAAQGRSRDGRAVRGQAVPRQPGNNGGGDTTIIVRPGYWNRYYPWGWGGLGVGSYYYGFYDPWWGGGYGYPAYGYSGYGYSRYDGYDGSLRIKVKPRDAEVFVDGYFAGRVDEFDGVFQSLKMEPGPHRIEIRGEGYEPLFFDVRIQPDRKITYDGELQPLP